MVAFPETNGYTYKAHNIHIYTFIQYLLVGWLTRGRIIVGTQHLTITLLLSLQGDYLFIS